MTLTVQAWADVACPLSYLCRGRLAEAIRRYHQAGGHHEVVVEYRSFELASDTPADYDGDEIDFLTSFRGMTPAEADTALSRLANVAAAEGLTLNFNQVRHANSRKAHELVHHAKTNGVQEAMVDRLMRAYFTEGRNIASIDELCDLATDIGLDRSSAHDALAANAYAAAVADDIEQAAFYRIRVLPFFLIGPKHGVSGAHDVGYYLEVLTKVADAADAADE